MYENLEELKQSLNNCQKCKLCKTRTNIVFGVGNPNAKIMFIGEGPGGDEDRLGEPFVGKAGQLMNKAFDIVGIKREEVYIANIVKCRPPQNRDPQDDEVVSCMDYLRNQVMIIKPKIIVLLGRIALQNILGKEYKITASRGKWVEKKGIMYMPTWHPAALLRDETKKIEFLKDLNEVSTFEDEGKKIPYGQDCLNCPAKPCSEKGCPLKNDIPSFIAKIKEKKYEEAYQILTKTTALPAVCGRICPHYKQCMGSCVRGIKGAPVKIGELETFIGDKAIEENWRIY